MATSTQVTGEQPACARLAIRTSSCSARRTCGTCSRSIRLREYAWKPSQSRGWRSTRELLWRKVGRACSTLARALCRIYTNSIYVVPTYFVPTCRVKPFIFNFSRLSLEEHRRECERAAKLRRVKLFYSQSSFVILILQM